MGFAFSIPMKLAVDRHHLLLEHAGTKRVTLNFLKQLKKNKNIKLVEFSPGYSLGDGKSIVSKIYGHSIRFFWVHVHLPILCRLKNVDFLLSPEYYTPFFTHCKRGVIAHDANIREQKQFVSSLWFYLYYVPIIETAIRHADVIFTVSKFAKRQIITHMKLDAAKVHVLYNGVDDCFMKTEQNPQEQKHFLDNKLVKDEYVLFVGTFEARKNIERLIEAFAEFKKRCAGRAGHIKLAIVGKPSVGMYSDRNKQISNLIVSSGLEEMIVLCGFVPDEDLPVYYRNALIVAFPSIYEGFGLPIIEAFACGTPVLTSKTCSMGEIAGDAALLIDPTDVGEMSHKLELLIFNKDLRRKLIAEGTERVKKFTWERSTQELLQQIRRSLSEHN